MKLLNLVTTLISLNAAINKETAGINSMASKTSSTELVPFSRYIYIDIPTKLPVPPKYYHNANTGKGDYSNSKLLIFSQTPTPIPIVPDFETSSALSTKGPKS